MGCYKILYPIAFITFIITTTIITFSVLKRFPSLIINWIIIPISNILGEIINYLLSLVNDLIAHPTVGINIITSIIIIAMFHYFFNLPTKLLDAKLKYCPKPNFENKNKFVVSSQYALVLSISSILGLISHIHPSKPLLLIVVLSITATSTLFLIDNEQSHSALISNKSKFILILILAHNILSISWFLTTIN